MGEGIARALTFVLGGSGLALGLLKAWDLGLMRELMAVSVGGILGFVILVAVAAAEYRSERRKGW